MHDSAMAPTATTSSSTTVATRSGCFLFSCAGCLTLGCLTLTVFTLLGALGGYLTLTRYIPSILITITTDTPPLIPTPPANGKILTSIQQKIGTLLKEVKLQGNVTSLVFSRDEVSSLIPALAPDTVFTRSVHVAVARNVLNVTFSFPLKDAMVHLPALEYFAPELRDRFLSGKVSLRPLVIDSLREIQIVQLRLHDTEVPPSLLRPLDSFLTAMLSKQSESVKIGKEGDNKLTFRISRLEVKEDSLYVSIHADELHSTSNPSSTVTTTTTSSSP